MRNKKSANRYKGFRELCRWCNVIAEVDVHLLVPSSEKRSQ
jgi:hypothetical protein